MTEASQATKTRGWEEHNAAIIQEWMCAEQDNTQTLLARNLVVLHLKDEVKKSDVRLDSILTKVNQSIQL